MDFTLTEDRRMIRDAARTFLAAEAGSSQRRTAIESDTGWDTALWRKLGEMGWLGALAPEAHGGQELGCMELALLLEEAGRALVAAPFLETAAMAVPAVVAAGDEAQQAELLPGLIDGSRLAALCLIDAHGELPPEGAPATLDKGRLDGRARFVTFAHSADLLLVAARTPGARDWNGLSLVALPADSAGVFVTRQEGLDLTRPYAEVAFEAVAVEPRMILGPPGEAGPAIRRMLAMGAGLMAAEQVGGASWCLETSVDYAKHRVQFGRPIGSFQAVKHILADMMLRIEAARSAAYLAAATLQDTRLQGDPEEAASSARAYCSDAYFACAGAAIQVHGGIGFTWEHDAHLHFRRARASANLLGDPAYHRERVARLIGLDDELQDASA